MDQHASTIPQRRTDVARKLAEEVVSALGNVAGDIETAPAQMLPAITAGLLRMRKIVRDVRKLLDANAKGESVRQ